MDRIFVLFLLFMLVYVGMSYTFSYTLLIYVTYTKILVVFTTNLFQFDAVILEIIIVFVA